MTATETPAGTEAPARTRVVHTACTLDCPDACSLAVTVADSAAGPRIITIDASPENPLTDGWICAKVKRHAERVYAPERVLTPLIRTGSKGEGAFRAATWEEATAVVAARMADTIQRKGAGAIAAFTYNSSAARVERASFTEALFAAIGAAEVEHTICAHTMGVSWQSVYGSMRSADPLDVVHSKLVVVWGANPTVSNTHFPPLVQQAVRAGARVVVIDPRRTAMAARADLHLAVRPGTDTALAYAVARLWALEGCIDTAFVAAHAGRGRRVPRRRRGVDPRTGCRGDRARGCRHRHVRAVVGLYASRNAAHRMGTRTQCQRRRCVPGHPLVAGARRPLRRAGERRHRLHQYRCGPVTAPVACRSIGWSREALAADASDRPVAGARNRRPVRGAVRAGRQPGGDVP